MRGYVAAPARSRSAGGRLSLAARTDDQTVAACEASIALALIVILYNQRSSLDITLWQDIREPNVPATPASDVAEEAEPIEAMLGPESYPHLTPAGVEPAHPVQSWIERRS